MTRARTNIRAAHVEAFEAIASDRFNNFALFSCFVNGEPAAAIVAVNRQGRDYEVTPLFVSVTPGMVLVDHEGEQAVTDAARTEGGDL